MARKHRTSELMAGLFVVVALAVAVGVVVWLGASEIFRPSRSKAFFYVEETAPPTDLGPGSYLYVGSTQVGRIAETRFDAQSGRTLYVADVSHPEVVIRRDARAVVQTGFLGGAQLVVVSRGSPDTPAASASEPVPIRQAGPFAMIEEVGGVVVAELDRSDPNSALGKIHDILTQLRGASATIQQMAGTVDRQLDPNQKTALLGKIHASLDDVNRITESLRLQASVSLPDSLLSKIHQAVDDITGSTGQLRQEMTPDEADALLAKVHKSVNDINEITADAAPRVRHIMTNVEASSEKMREYVEYDIAEVLINLRQTGTNILKLSRDFAALSGEARAVMELNRPNIDEMIDNMAAVSANLKAAAREIRRNPWRLLHRPKEGELETQNLFAAARDFATGAEQLDQALAKVQAADPETLGPEQMKRVRLHLEKSFEQFTRAERALWEEMSKRR